MTLVKKIDSSATGLRYAEETLTDIGVLPGSPTWIPLEPNTYGNFGVEITTVARDPISDDRQSKKGMVVDLEAGGGFQSDLTQVNIQDLMQGFMFADHRRKDEFGGSSQITSVTTTYNAASGLGVFEVDALVFASGFTNPTNNGLKRVTTSTATALTVTPALAAEAVPPATAKLVQVGRQFGAGVLDVDASGSFPAITGTALDTLGLGVGEPIFVGGDLAITKFVNAVNNGFKRIRSITATRIEFDKSLTTMVTEASTTETVQLFCGRVLKNEVGALIKRRTYQLERLLGAKDNASPSQIQSEYLIGQVANKLELQIGVADKVMLDMEFMGTNGETRTGVIGVKSGSRPALVEQDAFNTSSDFTFLSVAAVPTTGAAMAAIFGFLTELKLTINNNAKLNKAIGTLGAIEVTVGKFKVDGTMNAYFTDVAAIEAVKANTSHTIMAAMVKQNAGIVFDIPLVTLGDARLNIEQDTEISIPCKFDAASGAQVRTDLDHTILWCYYDYLPDAAQ